MTATEILKALADYPSRHGLLYSQVPLGVGYTLSAAQREELLSLANQAVIALAVGSQAAPPPAATPVPLPAVPALPFSVGDVVALTKDGETITGRPLYEGARGDVTVSTKDVVLVSFPEGRAEFLPAEAVASLTVVHDEDEDDCDDDDDQSD